jgi:hypothetical protein
MIGLTGVVGDRDLCLFDAVLLDGLHADAGDKDLN